MGSPYVGEIRIVGCNFAPVGWAFCNGAVMPISQNTTLFQLIGTTYGGDGVNTFSLPDLRGRIPVHQGTGGGSSYTMGQNGGVETVTLTTQQIPNHTHPALCRSAGSDSANPAGAIWSATSDTRYATSAAVNATMAPASIPQAGGSQPHDNLPPYLVVNFIISLFGIFPSQT